jgi:hypothetical protein
LYQFISQRAPLSGCGERQRQRRHKQCPVHPARRAQQTLEPRYDLLFIIPELAKV